MAVITSKVVQVSSLGPELLDNFADNPWETIIWACQTGNVPETWTVGGQKSMTINGKDYAIDIIGLYHDEYADGSGKAPITFQMHDCYGTAYAMNSTNTNVGGWTDCAMRNTHLPAILALMPSEVQAAIREVNKLTSAGNTSSTINTTADKLFLLSEIEAFGKSDYAASGEGEMYDYYNAANTTIKTISGSAADWYLRSPSKSYTNSFCFAASDGTKSPYGAATLTKGVPFAFCF